MGTLEGSFIRGEGLMPVYNRGLHGCTVQVLMGATAIQIP